MFEEEFIRRLGYRAPRCSRCRNCVPNLPYDGYMKSRSIHWLPETTQVTAYALADLKAVVGLIAFGSIARGATSERSDVDLLAICRETGDLASMSGQVIRLTFHGVIGVGS